MPLEDLASQWQRVEQNLRRLVERCTADGLCMTEDTDFESFLRLHRLTMQHHDTEPYLADEPFRQWFTSLSAAGLCRLFHARLPSGEPVAAQIVLSGPHPVTHTVCAAGDPAHRRTGAAAFLRWRVFEELARSGKSHNDLTDAALNSVTHFKSQFGGELVVNLVIETSGSLRWRMERVARRVSGGLRSRAARVWQHFRPKPRP